MSLAPDLAAGHEALGFVLVTPDLDFAGAEAEFRKAEKLAPADAGPKFALSFLFAAQGRLAEAENIMRQTLPLDPLGVTRYLNFARILIADNRYDEAEAALRKAIELQPAAARLHSYLTMLDVLRGNAAAALRDAQLEEKGFWRDYALALASRRRVIAPRLTLPCKNSSTNMRRVVLSKSPLSTVCVKNPTKCLSGSNALIPNTTPV